MKIRDIYYKSKEIYPDKLVIIKKWIFWLLFEEEAFFMSKFFNFKITKFENNLIKIWFPDWTKEKWLKVLKDKNLSYVLIIKNWEKFDISDSYNWIYFTEIFQINIEDLHTTKTRILELDKLNIEDINDKNFLLQNKIEDLYILLSELLIRLPKKERFYFRQKIENLMLDILESVYSYKYNFTERKSLIVKIKNKAILVREFVRMLYNSRRISNDNVYIDLSDRWLEILKICKWIENRR